MHILRVCTYAIRRIRLKIGQEHSQSLCIGLFDPHEERGIL